MIEERLVEDLQQNAAVVILGPRQVGKTTLALQVAARFDSLYLDLENPADRRKIEDPLFYFQQNAGRLIVLDEVQRQPGLFQPLRAQIDSNRRAGHRRGQFLLLGSASRALLRQSSESLAGRALYEELFPLNLLETGEGALNALWLRGGFPESFLQESFSLRWRNDLIRTYLERDIPALGSRVPAETLRRFWTMLAHCQGQIFNASRLGGALGVSGQSASRYLDLLCDLMLVRRLLPWHANTGKRLVKSPKTYIRDSGLLHALLNIRSLDELLGHPVAGSSWEGFVIENLVSAAPAHVQAYFYRTAAGAEIDLLLELGGGKLWAVEIKKSTAPKLSRGFHLACQDLSPAAKWLVYTGQETYRLKSGITVISLADLMKRLKEE